MSNVDDIVQSYFHLGFNYMEIVHMLAASHDINISLRTLKRKLNHLGLCRKKNMTDANVVYSFILTQLEEAGQMHGYLWMHQKCLHNGLVVTRETVRQMLKIADEEGVEMRRKKRLRRRTYFAKGPNYIWHFDSYDKLKPYGICINGCIDGFSRNIMWLKHFNTSSDPKVIAGYFITTVKELGGCPLIMRSDMGTENGHVEVMEKFLRRHGNDSRVGSCFLYGKSTSNQRIESWWGQLRREGGQFWMNIFQELKETGSFTGDWMDKNLIQFCFGNLIQNELDNIVRVWNTHRISKNRRSNLPHGRPHIMYSLPQQFGVEDYLCPVKEEEVMACETECTLIANDVRCDEDVNDICNLLIAEHNISIPTSALEGVDLYTRLRQEILNNM